MAVRARITKGVLLVGPPGTGKTLLAKAVAGEAAVPASPSPAQSLSRCSSAWVRSVVRAGPAGRRRAIIFIDELDALAARGVGGHDEREQTPNPAAHGDGRLDSSVGLIILTATNRPEILDWQAAACRPLRPPVLLDRPDIKKGRLDILEGSCQEGDAGP